MSPTPDPVTERSFATAQEFIEALSPTGCLFGPKNDSLGPRTIAYRGQSDARWPLLPSVLRKTRAQVNAAAAAGSNVKPRNAMQAAQEQRELAVFFDVADHRGLALPEDSLELRNALRGNVSLPWPHERLWPLLALVQHHGISTRLLDWTRSSYVAAYFAAFEATLWVRGKKQLPSGVTHLAVWAMADYTVKLSTEYVLRQMDSAKHPIGELRIVTAPEYENPNLHAQKGIFSLYIPPDSSPNGLVDLRPLEEIVRDEFQISGVLEKLSLPISEAPRLLMLLAHYDINGASLFPGYDGVVKYIDEMWMWERSA